DSVARVLAAFPDERVGSVSIDPENHPGVLLVATLPNDGAGDFNDASLRFPDLTSGEPIDARDPSKSLTGVLLELHAQWFLGPFGELFGALIALLVLLSLLSGLVVYAPYARRVAFGMLRRGRGARILQIDLHNLIGTAVLGWALVVTVTGLLLGFSTLAIGIWQATELAGLRAHADGLEPVDVRNPPAALGPAGVATPPADVDRACAAARASAPPGWKVVTAIFPGTQFSTPRHYTVLLEGTEGIEQRLFRVAAIDAATGEVAAAVAPP